jgi:hypothetical protein
MVVLRAVFLSEGFVSFELATPRHRNAPPLVGLLCLSGSYRAAAPSRLLGWREPSMPLVDTVPKHSSTSASRSHAAALHRPFRAGKIPAQD